MNFNVGDMIYGSINGLGFITEVCDPTSDDLNELQTKLRGLTHFKYMILMGTSSKVYTIRASELHRWRLATDDDIIKNLTSSLCSFWLDENTGFDIHPESRAVGFYKEDQYIWLDESAIKSLKKHLKEISL